MQATYYTLGQGYALKADGSPLTSWPFDLGYVPARADRPFWVAEGDGRNGAGSFVAAADLLTQVWSAHLERTGAAWLRPLLRRIAEGGSLSADAILAAYEAAHGEAPASCEIGWA